MLQQSNSRSTLSTFAVVAFFASFAPSVAFAGPATMDIEMSGGTTLMVVDADGDGPDPDDCILTATYSEPNVTFLWTQNNTPLIRGCSGSNPGSLTVGQDTSSDWIYATSETANGPNGTVPPMLLPLDFAVDAYEEFYGGTPNGLPAALNTADIETLSGNKLLTAYLCDDGTGPTTILDGPLASGGAVNFYPDDTNPTHIVALSVPFQLAPSEGSGITDFDIFIPTIGKRVTLGIEGVTPLLVDIDMANLSPCQRTSPAPAMSPRSILPTICGLLAAGTWLLRRRNRAQA